MITVLKSSDRGHANHGWLDTFHTFSFADYYNPKMMAFRDLRVINEDTIKGGQGFPTHGHRDMEILTYVIEGGLGHRDSMGNSTVIRPGDVQRMSAGTGVRHSEYSTEGEGTTHLLQIWILPEKEGITPSYGQKSFLDDFRSKNFVLVASRDGTDGSVIINQNVKIYVGRFANGDKMAFAIPSNRHVWLQVVKGDLEVAGRRLQPGDGLSASDESELRISAKSESEFLLFDLA